MCDFLGALIEASNTSIPQHERCINQTGPFKPCCAVAHGVTGLALMGVGCYYGFVIAASNKDCGAAIIVCSILPSVYMLGVAERAWNSSEINSCCLDAGSRASITAVQEGSAHSYSTFSPQQSDQIPQTQDMQRTT